MKQIFRDVRNNFLLTAIVSVLIGLVLVLFPVRTTFMICNIAGILLIVCGIINIIRYVISKGEAFFIRYDLVVGVILCLAGLFVITQSHLIISFIPTIVGIVLLINGIINLKKAFHLKQAGLQRWWVDLAIAAVIELILCAKQIPYLEYVPFLCTLVGMAVFIKLAFDEIGDVLSNINMNGLSTSWIASAVLIVLTVIVTALSTVFVKER